MDYSWFKERTYLHFDPPITKFQILNITKIVSTPAEVARHSFYPLIKFEVVKYKMRVNPEEEVRKLDKSKTRELTYCAHLDAHILSYYSQNLQKIYEEEIQRRGIQDSVLAFRKLKTNSGQSKNNIHFANDAFDCLISMKEGTAYAFDLKKFFDSIDHSLLKEKWCKLLHLKTLPEDHYKIFKFITNRSLVSRESLIKEFQIPKRNARRRKKHKIYLTHEMLVNISRFIYYHLLCLVFDSKNPNITIKDLELYEYSFSLIEYFTQDSSNYLLMTEFLCEEHDGWFNNSEFSIFIDKEDRFSLIKIKENLRISLRNRTLN